jgi:hypothetical protein
MASVDGKLFQTGFTGLQDSDIERFLQRKLNADQKIIITDLIKEIEYDFASQCNRNFDPAEIYYETFDSIISRVMLYNTPLATLSKIYVDGVDVTSQYVLNTDYWVFENEIGFLTPVVSQSGYNGVKLEYTIKQFWGDDVIRAIKKMVARNFLTSADGGLNQQTTSFSNISQSFDLAGFEKEWENIIFRYTNFNI